MQQELPITAASDARAVADSSANGVSPRHTGTKLRILIITEDDPLYVRQFFHVFFEMCEREEFEICGVTVARAFHEPLWKTGARLWRFFGPIDFVRLLTRFVRAKVRHESIQALAEERGIAILPTASVNDPLYVKQVRSLAPDVIVSVAAPEIFRKDILSAARLRCINIHSGRLPKYRGMMPAFWQLLHGEEHATITIHDMAEKLDAGAVLGISEFGLRQRDSLDRVIVGTKRAGARLMIDVLRQISKGTVNVRPLDMAAAGYFSFPTPAHVRAFRRKGHRLL